MKILKNEILVGSVVATLALFGFLSMNRVEAMMTSAGSTTVDGCASGAMYNTITGAACADVVMNPPALGVLPVGCDLGVGTVYSPETGESCSINGVAITPPIVMVYPYDAYGCKAGSPYSMTTGAKCAGFSTSGGFTSTTDVCGLGVMYNTKTGAKCSTPTTMPPVSSNGCGYGAMYDTTTGAKCSGNSGVITPLPPVYDCTMAKNAGCAGTISSTSDVAGIQAALNRILGSKLSATLTVDGKLGAKTAAAVKLFQAQVGIAVDGKVGPITLGKLNAQ